VSAQFGCQFGRRVVPQKSIERRKDDYWAKNSGWRKGEESDWLARELRMNTWLIGIYCLAGMAKDM